MALAAGCTIIVKASELCPLTHHLLVSCLEEAGIPKGVLNVIQARREDAAPVVEALIAHTAVRKVDFIGSAAVGSKIGQVCAKYLKPILMELGGKGPALVLEDADLEKAAGLCALGGEFSPKFPIAMDENRSLTPIYNSDPRPRPTLLLHRTHHRSQVRLRTIHSPAHSLHIEDTNSRQLCYEAVCSTCIQCLGRCSRKRCRVPRWRARVPFPYQLEAYSRYEHLCRCADQR
jgi:hypothetical protein